MGRAEDYFGSDDEEIGDAERAAYQKGLEDAGLLAREILKRMKREAQFDAVAQDYVTEIEAKQGKLSEKEASDAYGKGLISEEQLRKASGDDKKRQLDRHKR